MTPRNNYELYARTAVALGQGVRPEELRQPDHPLSGYFVLTSTLTEPYIPTFERLYTLHKVMMDSLASLIDQRVAIINQIRMSPPAEKMISLEKHHTTLESQISLILNQLDEILVKANVPTTDWNR